MIKGDKMKFNMDEVPDEGRADFPKFELSMDEIARANLLSIKGWEVSLRHFVKGIGYVHCHAAKNAKDTKELLKIQQEAGRPDECLMCKISATGTDRVSAPQRRFATRILRYKTNLNGEVSGGNLSYWLEIWILDNRKFKDLQKIVSEWGGKGGEDIRNHDILISCTNQQYQNMTLQTMQKALWVADKEEVIKYFKEEAVKYNLSECLGEVMEQDALERRFAQIERRTQKTDAPVDFPYGELAKEPVGEASEAKAVTTGDDPFDIGSSGGELPAVEEKKPESPEPVSEGESILDDLL